MRIAPWMFMAILVASAGVLAAAPTTSRPDQATTAPDPIPLNQDSPRSLLETMQKAAEAVDPNVMAACADPAYQKSVKVMYQCMRQFKTSLESLSKSVEAKLGKTSGTFVIQTMKDTIPEPLGNAMEDGKVNWDKVKITADGDKATVKVAGDAPFTLMKVNGKWHYGQGPISVEEMAKAAEKVNNQIPKTVKELGDLEDGVKAGTVTKAEFTRKFRDCLAAFAQGAQ